MEAGNIVGLSIRAAVRRNKAVLSKIAPYVENSKYQKNSPINGLVKFGVVKEVASGIIKVLEVFKTDDKKTLTIPKHLKASIHPGAANIVDVVCIVKFGRETKLVAQGKKFGVIIKAEETKKGGRKVGKIQFSIPMSTPKSAQSLAGLINTHEKIETVGPGK
jgi:hypothetical protein